jgi:hypothetical protein
MIENSSLEELCGKDDNFFDLFPFNLLLKIYFWGA